MVGNLRGGFARAGGGAELELELDDDDAELEDDDDDDDEDEDEDDEDDEDVRPERGFFIFSLTLTPPVSPLVLSNEASRSGSGCVPTACVASTSAVLSFFELLPFGILSSQTVLERERGVLADFVVIIIFI